MYSFPSTSPFWHSCAQSFHPTAYIGMEVALTQVQHLAHGFIEPHDVHLDALLKPVCPNGQHPEVFCWYMTVGATGSHLQFTPGSW